MNKRTLIHMWTLFVFVFILKSTLWQLNYLNQLQYLNQNYLFTENNAFIVYIHSNREVADSNTFG